MIKNWIVTTEQVSKNSKYRKGKRGGKTTSFTNYINYLKNQNASSHAETNIVMLHNNAHNIVSAVDARTEHRRAAGLKGGGVQNMATSFTMSFPKSIDKQPTVNDWNEIACDAVRIVAKDLNIEYEKLLAHTHIVLHQEKGSKNSHVNLVMSNVIDNKVIKAITQKNATWNVKKSFNESIERLLNVSNNDYVPVHVKPQSKPLFIARKEKAERVEKELSRLKDQVKIFKNNLRNWAKNFLHDIFKQAEFEAEIVAESIDNVENISSLTANDLDKITEFVESKKLDAPESAKVSPKRKRRRRKKP